MNSNQLKKVILKIAESVSKMKRDEFLKNFEFEEIIEYNIDYDILHKLDLLIEDIENYNFADDIGDVKYDHFGKEYYISEDSDLILQLVKFIEDSKQLYKANQFNLLNQVIDKIFLIDELQSEGYVPSFTTEIEEELDLEELSIIQLICQYHLSEVDKRAENMLNGLDNIYHVSLEDVMTYSKEELPEVQKFYKDIIEINNNKHIEQIIDAIYLSQGIDGLVEYINNDGKKQTSAYLKLLNQLEMTEDFAGLEKYALKGIKEISINNTKRADISKYLLSVGKLTSNSEYIIKSLQISLESKPVISDLVELLDLKYHSSHEEINIEKLVTRFKKISTKEQNNEKSYCTKRFLVQAYLLTGDYISAINIVDKKEQSYWSDIFSVNQLSIVTLLKLLIPKSKSTHILDNFIQNDLSSSDFINQDIQIRFLKIINYFQPIQINSEIDIISWCTSKIFNQVDEILNNQYRDSYSNIAQLLAALAEFSLGINQLQHFYSVFEPIKKKYPRHRKFHNELEIIFKEFKLKINL